MSVDLRKYVKPTTVCVYREPLSKHSVIEKITELASIGSENSETLKHFIAGALQAREMLGSTALTRGLALPHCRVEGINDFIVGILVSPEGVAYGSLDGKLSRVFFFIIAPKENVEEHLNFMSEIGAFLNKEENIISLAESRDSETLYQKFLKLWEEYTENLI